MTVEQMADKYRAGAGLLDLEIATGLSRNKIRDALAAAGVEIRRRGGVRGGCGGQKFRDPGYRRFG